MENDKIISLSNLFQHLLSAEIFLNEKLNLYFTNLVRKFQINARNKRKVPPNILEFHLENVG